ncbi:DNA repair protein RecO [Brevundimonas sp. 2R-24]|uniref:DNA repair protein RecO n=1 Tax=Peiella sedimenti TaxID=3061083 RepID=A0ABT8SNB6_9CAUL|nr:DNA repair protein RecO [Caulobacteraceae bacterium XZ-24]
MEFSDDAFVLAARGHGETGAIVDLLTERHGRIVAHVAGGASRKLKPVLQAGVRVMLDYRARTSEQLGSARLEPLGEGAAAFFDDSLALAAVASAAAVAQGALPEREPHPGAFLAFDALLSVLALEDVWPAVMVRYEMGLLEELGFGLDLTKCASTGVTEDLVWVSPRTGRAVSREAGAPYAERMLPLPGFLLGAQMGVAPGDIGAGLKMTAHFLEAFVFGPMNRPLPPARLWLVDRLEQAGRL